MKILKKNRFWVAVGILCFSAFLWLISGMMATGTPPQPLSITVRILILISFLFTALIIITAVIIRGMKTNSAMISDISAPEENESSTAVINEEARQMQEKFSRAVELLKTRRFGNESTRQHLYEMPWYVIIGSPGSGKTTAIRHSGLDFPLEALTGDASLGGIGGTRNCDWWITEDAVLLDTAGRYTTQDSNKARDAKGWNNFLELLKKYRKRQPINGALVVLSTDELINLSPEQWKNHLSSLRARLAELSEKLNVSYPTYLLITKMDLLTGFREFFDSLDSNEQEQVWGVTLPLEGDVGLAVQGFDELTQRLHKQLPGKMRVERDLRRRQAMYNFPWQMEVLKPRLEEFLTTTFGRAAFGPRLVLRGIYLTSAVQQGTPIEKLFASVTSSFGISSNISTQLRSSRSLFLKQAFRDVIFPEAMLAGTNRRHTQRNRTLRAATFTGIVATGALLAFTWSSSFTIHKVLLEKATSNLHVYEDSIKHNPDLTGILQALRNLESAAQVFDERQHPWLTGLGMYDSAADDAAKAAYLKGLQQTFGPGLGQAITIWLNQGNNYEYADRVNALKAYLMLTNRDRRDEDYLQDWLGKTPIPSIQQDQEGLTGHFLKKLYELDSHYQLSPADNVTVERTRASLAHMTPAERIYAMIKQAHQEEKTDLRERMGNFYPIVFSTNKADALIIPSLFTQSGYNNVDFSTESPFYKSWQDDQWVLESEQTAAMTRPDQIAREILTFYAIDYITIWQQVVASLSLNNPVSMDALINTLGRLSDTGTSPLAALINTIATETRLQEKATLQGQATDKLSAMAAATENAQASKIMGNALKTVSAPQPESPLAAIGKAFDPIQKLTQGEAASKNMQIAMTLSELRQWLSGIYMIGGAGGTAALQAIQPGGGLDPARKTLLLSSELPQPVSTWVAALARAAQNGVNTKAKGQLDQNWKEQVVQPCKNKIAGRFPLNANAPAGSDVSLDDFSAFFKSDGILDSFVKQTLKPYMGSGVVSGGTLAMIDKANSIRDHFLGSSGSPHIAYRITPVKMDADILQITLEINGQTINYSHGPKTPYDLVWPDITNAGIKLSFRLADGQIIDKQYDGSWALFRLIRASTQPGTADASLLAFSDGAGHIATWKIFDADGKGNLSAISNFQCKEDL